MPRPAPARLRPSTPTLMREERDQAVQQRRRRTSRPSRGSSGRRRARAVDVVGARHRVAAPRSRSPRRSARRRPGSARSPASASAVLRLERVRHHQHARRCHLERLRARLRASAAARGRRRIRADRRRSRSCIQSPPPRSSRRRAPSIRYRAAPRARASAPSSQARLSARTPSSNAACGRVQRGQQRGALERASLGGRRGEPVDRRLDHAAATSPRRCHARGRSPRSSSDENSAGVREAVGLGRERGEAARRHRERRVVLDQVEEPVGLDRPQRRAGDVRGPPRRRDERVGAADLDAQRLAAVLELDRPAARACARGSGPDGSTVTTRTRSTALGEPTRELERRVAGRLATVRAR